MSSTNEQQITQMDLDKPLENPIRKKTHTCSRTIIIITAITIILTMIICAGIGIINYISDKPPACQAGYSCRNKDNPCGDNYECRTQPCKTEGATCQPISDAKCPTPNTVCRASVCPSPCADCDTVSSIKGKIKVSKDEDDYLVRDNSDPEHLSVKLNKGDGDVWTFTIADVSPDGLLYTISNDLGECIYPKNSVGKFELADCDINKHKLYMEGNMICDPSHSNEFCLGHDDGKVAGKPRGDGGAKWFIIPA